MTYSNPAQRCQTGQMASGSIRVEAPSNIALVKYWGKHGDQLPRNPNLSFTLREARSETELAWQPRGSETGGEIELDFYFNGKQNEPFAHRIRGYFKRLSPIYPWLEQWHWTMRSRNTFPHGAGIASSASAMAAVAWALVELEEHWFGQLPDVEKRRKSSYIARLGSGSAARSVFPEAAAWGQSIMLPGSSDEYAVSVADHLHDNFRDYRDSILLVSAAEKAVSSSAGHALMNGHPYASRRYELATARFGRLLEILERGELTDFCELVEADALDLHALMMQSTPSYLLIEPQTVALIQQIRRFRHDTGLPLCFTLDAGPNVHLLYPQSEVAAVRKWLREQVAPHLPQGILHDCMGAGAQTVHKPVA